MSLRRTSPATLVQLALLGIILLLAFASLLRAMPAFFRPLDAIDFSAYYLAANVLAYAEPLYVEEYMHAAAERMGIVYLTEYLYPPFFAGMLRPLGVLEYQLAARIWLVLNVALAALATVVMVQAARLPLWSLPLALLATFSVPAVITTLLIGQVNIVLFVLISAAVYATVRAQDASAPRQQAGWDALAGALIGVAAVVKVFPAALGVVFLLHRRLPALFGMAGATLLCFLVGVPLAGGVPNTWNWFGDVLFQISAAVNEDNSVLLQGAGNVFGRLFETHTFTYDFMQVGNSTQQTFPALIEAPRLGQVLALLVNGLIFAATMLWVLVRARQHQPAATDLVLVTAMLMLITPVVWDYYYVLWLIPLAWLVRFYGQLPLAARWLVLFGCLLIVLHRYWRLLAQVVASPLLLGLGFAGSLCLWVAMMILTNPFHQPTARGDLA